MNSFYDFKNLFSSVDINSCRRFKSPQFKLNFFHLSILVLLLFSVDTINAQCTEPSCLPTSAALGANGPDPCNAKLYCSNSGAVQTGLINCTNAADTDGCGVNADAASSAASTYASADASVVELFSGGQYNTGTYLQWIVFATPPTVKGTKIQGVGAVDSWWLFHAGSVTVPGDYATVEDALTDPARCDSFDSTNLVIGSNANQYEPWLNEDAVIAQDVYNIYYIALFWDTPTNGSLNFKVKECELGCPDVFISCPEDDVQAACQSQAAIDLAFDNWKNQFTFTGGEEPITETYLVNGLAVDINALQAPDRCGGTLTITYEVSDNCPNFETCTSTFTVLPDNTAPVLDPEPGDIMVQCVDDVPPPFDLGWTDNCDGSGTVQSTDGPLQMPGQGFNDVSKINNEVNNTCGGTITRTWTYTDSCGNSDTATQIITVDYTQGVTAPMDETATVECPAEAVDPGAPATVQDACGRDVVPVLVGSTSVPDPVTCEGTVVWTYRYTDCTGQGTDDWTYTYTIDITTPPNAGMDDGSNVQCLDDAVQPTPPSGITDVCNRPIVPTGPVVNTDFDGCMGTRTYTWTYTDCSGLSDDWVYTYTIEDTTDPEIINLPAPGPLCNDPFPPYLEADWIDNCAAGGPLQSGEPVITMLDTCTEQGVYTFYVEDDCGNSDTETVTVIR
ncbi:MAG: hypothetical protein KJO39_04055, partial [Bacteroidia bacterium]|nr:hypothetical protein [Bacteroidia bacterium]